MLDGHFGGFKISFENFNFELPRVKTCIGKWCTNPNLLHHPHGLVHNLLMELFTLGNSKIEVFGTSFFDGMIT